MTNSRTPIVSFIVLISCGIAGCTVTTSDGTTGGNANGGAISSGSSATPGPIPALPAPNEAMPPTSVGTDATLARGVAATVQIDSRADIFSASQATANTDRGGVLPSRLTLASGTGRTITFSAATGLVGCASDQPSAPPTGGTCAGGATDIESADGISGIIHASRTHFLTGVFLNGPASPQAPERLNVTPGQPGVAQSLRPALGQQFYIGDVTAPIAVPEGATHLYLGVADAAAFQGAPGCYGDNTGGFRATVTLQ